MTEMEAEEYQEKHWDADVQCAYDVNIGDE